MGETANAFFEVVTTREPLTSPQLRAARRRRNLSLLLLAPFDLVGVGGKWVPKRQYVVTLRHRQTKVAVAVFSYLCEREARDTMNDLRARLQLESTPEFCRSLGLQLPIAGSDGLSAPHGP